MLEYKDLKGKVAFVTGGARGIGLETARGLARSGASVIIGARSETAGHSAATTLREEGLDVGFIMFDVVKPADHQAVYRLLDDQYGRLDILVNNAGILKDVDSISQASVNRTSTLPEKDLRETFDVNFFAPVLLTQTLLPLIRRSSGGRIVNVSTVLGSLTLQAAPGSPIYGVKTFAYNASKTALNAFTVHLAHELKDTNIKVNSVHPGWVRTSLGGSFADMDETEGSLSSIAMASLDEQGPSGAFVHGESFLPW